MKLIPVKTPFIVKKIFQNYVWDIKTDEKVLYLTFDDGPTPDITDWTLNELKRHQAKATFFCIGNNIEKHPAIFKRIEEEGHAIGNHTFNHVKGWQTNTVDYIAEVLKTQASIDSKIAPQQSKIANLFRPPYGQITKKQGQELRELGYKIIMWDVLGFDWEDDITSEQCYQNISLNANSGSIIVLHDSLKASKHLHYALPKVLDFFSEKGFEFRRIPE